MTRDETLVELASADPGTAAVLAALHAHVFADAWAAPAFQALLQIPGTHALVALADGQPVGFAVVRHVLDEAEIITIGVVPACQRQGHARRLMRAIARRAVESGVRAIFLEVSAANMPAQALYAALGFVPVGCRKGYYVAAGTPAADALVLRLTFEPSGPAPDDDGVAV